MRGPVFLRDRASAFIHINYLVLRYVPYWNNGGKLEQCAPAHLANRASRIMARKLHKY